MTIVFDNNIVCYKQDLGVEFSGLKVESVDTRNLVNPYRCLSQVPVQILHSFCNSMRIWNPSQESKQWCRNAAAGMSYCNTWIGGKPMMTIQ